MQTDREYCELIEILRTGSAVQFEEVAQRACDFPSGVDSFVGRRWIINAIDVGSLESVRWMLDKHVDLHFSDEEGTTPLHAAIERNTPDRYEVLRLLLDAGAPVNLKGVNDFTPPHLAAVRDDVDSLRLLVEHGADVSIRTEIDESATPLEEAEYAGNHKAAQYLASIA